MAFDWTAFVELARILHLQAESAANPEAYRRNVVSRAYYGAFCFVRNYARDILGFEARNDAEDHGRLRACLKTGKMRGISDKLERLREWRNGCDYSDKLPFDLVRAAKEALTLADAILALLQPPDKGAAHGT